MRHCEISAESHNLLSYRVTYLSMMALWPHGQHAATIPSAHRSGMVVNVAAVLVAPIPGTFVQVVTRSSLHRYPPPPESAPTLGASSRYSLTTASNSLWLLHGRTIPNVAVRWMALISHLSDSRQRHMTVRSV